MHAVRVRALTSSVRAGRRKRFKGWAGNTRALRPWGRSLGRLYRAGRRGANCVRITALPLSGRANRLAENDALVGASLLAKAVTRMVRSSWFLVGVKRAVGHFARQNFQHEHAGRPAGATDGPVQALLQKNAAGQTSQSQVGTYRRRDRRISHTDYSGRQPTRRRLRMVSVRFPGGASLLLGGGTKQRQQHDIDQSKEI